MDTSKTIDILNDLIIINNDRAAGFEKAVADIAEHNNDIKQVFIEYAGQSRKYSQELGNLVQSMNAEIKTGTSVSSSVHRVWMDLLSVFSANDRLDIINEAERGEDAIKEAYKDALREETLSDKVREVITSQAGGINRGNNAIKALRDTANEV